MLTPTRGLIQFLRTHVREVERVSQRSGLCPGQAHPRKVGFDAAVDVGRGGIGGLGEGAAVVKHGGGFGEGQVSSDTDEPGRERQQPLLVRHGHEAVEGDELAALNLHQELRGNAGSRF